MAACALLVTKCDGQSPNLGDRHFPYIHHITAVSTSIKGIE
ncbi:MULTISPECIES: hypothetical protein [Nostocales]|nr:MULTISPECIES: hypothetical protein [Nostocales]